MTSHNFVFTINNYTAEDGLALESAKESGLLKYVVCGKEVAPTTGTPHIQGFLVTTKKSRVAAVARIIPRGFIQIARGKATVAAEYCKKDGDYEEYGTIVDPGTMEKNRWDDAYAAAKEGRFEDIPKDIMIRHLGNIKRIFADAQMVPASVATLDNQWFYGPTGTGKSLTARTENPGYYIKNKNKWWDGYRSQPCVIIEEWDPHYSETLGSFLKEWADHHPFCAETKGGSMCIRPPKLVVTSNYSMEECFLDDKLLEPLRRRFKIHHFNTPFVKKKTEPTLVGEENE